MILTILAVVTLIAFASPSTRWVRLLSVALLIYLQLVLTLTAQTLLGGAFFIGIDKGLSTMNHNVILNAADVVLGWDLPDEALPEALLSQARFMSGIAEGGFEEFRMH